MPRRLRWRLEQGKIFDVTADPAPVGLAKAKAVELTEEKCPRCAMPLGWLSEIDHGDTRAVTQRRKKIEE
jgi:hypothetical protein